MKIKPILLHGEIWADTIDKLMELKIFRTYYDIYKLCITLGIFFDKQIENTKSTIIRTIPVTMPINDMANLQKYFETAVLTSELNILKGLDIDEKIMIAFNPEYVIPFEEIDFLTMFANYGVTIICKWITKDDLSTIRNFHKNLKEYAGTISIETLDSLTNDSNEGLL